MAQNNENLSNFIDQKAWSDFERLEKVIASAADSMEFLSLTAQEAFKGLTNAGTLQQLIELMNKAQISTKGLDDTQKKLKTGIKELNEEQIKQNMTTKEANDYLKLQIAAQNTNKDTIAGMRAEIHLLTFEYNRLDLEKQKDLANNKKLELDAKNATLKTKVDAYTAQKINIGNYPELIIQADTLKRELDALAQSGQKDSTEFKNLSGQLGTLTSAMGGAAGELTWTIGQMNTLASSGRMDSVEFKILAERAAELKAQLSTVKTAINEASANAERGAVSMERFAESMKEIGKFALAFFGVQAGMEFISGISEEFEKADKAARNLRNTLDNIGSANLFGKLTEESEKFAEKFSYLDTYEIQNVFSKLITYGKLSEDQIKESIPVIIDFAAKSGQTLPEATKLFTTALEGSARGLKEYGINIKDAKDATGKMLPESERFGYIMDQLKPRVAGAAEAFKNGWSGAVESWKKDIREIELSIADFFVKISGVEERQFQAAVTARKEADQTQKLVSEYETLSKKVNQTANEKKRLSDITTTLSAMYGNSVVNINAETGAITLNIEATKELIKQKLLLNNQAAGNVAMQYNSAEENRKKNADEFVKAQLLYNNALKETGVTMAQIEAKLTPGKSDRLQELTPDEEKVLKLFNNAENYKKAMDKFLNAKIEAAEKLRQLGFEESDVDKLFAPGELNPGKNIPATPGGMKPDFSKLDSEYYHRAQTRDQYDQEIADKEEARQKKIQDAIKVTQDMDQEAQNQKTMALTLLNQQYEKGDIDYETYTKAKEKLDEQFVRSSLLLHIAYFKDLQKLYPDDKTIAKQLSDAEAAFANSAVKKPDDKDLGAKALEKQAWAAVGSAISETKSIMDSYYEAEIAHLENKKKLIDDNYSAEINAIQGSFMSQQKQGIAIAQLKAQQRQQDKEIQDEIRRDKQRMAAADKVAAILEIAEKTAVATMAAVAAAAPGDPYTLAAREAAAAAIVIGLGAASAAAVIAKQTPQYGSGTEGLPGGVHPGGDAIVGELNKPEYIFKPGDRTAQIVNRATRLNLPFGTRVFTEEQLLRDSMDMLPDAMLYQAGVNSGVEHVIRDSMMELKGEISDMKETIKNKQENYFHWDNGELRKSVKRGNDWTTYLDSNFN